QAARPVVHVAIHSFTPVLGDDVRDFELGLLYDPQRPRERRFADSLHAGLAARAPEIRIRRNAPYRGTSDGLPTAFRKARRPAAYLGLEIELNQVALGTRRERTRWVALLAPVLREALEKSS
ncbi:N-formylglutamate amidohydrolase, partial [Myxococcota bacterium]|nr:N-formylglutamate amidohydrolase [Myxococcota bacterium]